MTWYKHRKRRQQSVTTSGFFKQSSNDLKYDIHPAEANQSQAELDGIIEYPARRHSKVSLFFRRTADRVRSCPQRVSTYFQNKRAYRELHRNHTRRAPAARQFKRNRVQYI